MIVCVRVRVRPRVRVRGCVCLLDVVCFVRGSRSFGWAVLSLSLDASGLVDSNGVDSPSQGFCTEAGRLDCTLTWELWRYR